MADGEPLRRDVRALLEAGQPALAKLREGLGKPCVVILPGWDSDDPSERSEAGCFIPYAYGCLHVALLLRWEGWLHRERGDFAAAFRSYLDAIAFGQDIAQNQGLVGRLRSIVCEGIGCADIRRTLAAARDHEGLLAAVVSDLAQVEADEITYAEVLMMEYRYALRYLHWYREEIERDREWVLGFEEEYGSRTPAAYLILTRRDVDRYYSQLVAAAQGDPWEWRRADIRKPEENSMAYWFAPPDGHTHCVVRHLATVRGTLLVAALELYRARHGAYPESLSDLVPETLAQVPLDPFCGEPFRYSRRDADTYTLYSVGENLKDDGGRDRWGPGVDKAESDLVFSTEN